MKLPSNKWSLFKVDIRSVLVGVYVFYRGSLYYQPKRCTSAREIPRKYHTFASSLILPKFDNLQGPLPVISVITPINGLRTGFAWGYNWGNLMIPVLGKVFDYLKPPASINNQQDTDNQQANTIEAIRYCHRLAHINATCEIHEIHGFQQLLGENSGVWTSKLVGGWTTPSKNISQIGNLPQIGVNIKNLWNHHLENDSLQNWCLG